MIYPFFLHGLCIFGTLLPVTSCAWGEKCLPNYVGLHDFFRRHGFSMKSLEKGNIALSNVSTKFLFKPGSRRLTFNNLVLYMNAPLLKTKDKWMISGADINNLFKPLLDPKASYEFGEAPVLILDPGHGGNDSGARGQHKTIEKKITLDIAKQIRKKLQLTGIDIFLTREEDRTIDLDSRSLYAKKMKADVFVSIHVNSSPNHNAHGIETYILPICGFPPTSEHFTTHNKFSENEFSKCNLLLAYYIHDRMIRLTQAADRGVRRANWKVLRNAPCPAVLLECGFLSNINEEGNIGNTQYRERISESIANGILNYVASTSQKVLHP